MHATGYSETSAGVHVTWQKIAAFISSNLRASNTNMDKFETERQKMREASLEKMEVQSLRKRVTILLSVCGMLLLEINRKHASSKRITGVLISPYPDQEGNKLIFLSEWREFPSTPCLAGKET